MAQHNNSQERKLERMLRVALFRRTCPDTMILSDYQLGLLNPTEHAQVHAHVARCPHCQAELARLKAFVVGHSTRPIDSGWIAGVGFEWQRLLQAGRKTGRVAIRLMREALALPLAPLPVRGKRDESSAYRRMALHPEQTGGLDVYAEVQRSGTAKDVCRLKVRAQVPGRWPELAGTVVRVRAGEWSREAVTDEDGQVVIEDIPAALVDMMMIEADPGADSGWN